MKSQVGLSTIPPHVLPYVWLITNIPPGTPSWTLSPAFDRRNPLETVYIVFEGIGHLSYYDVKDLDPPRLVTRAMLKPIPVHFVLPWEIHQEDAEVQPFMYPELLWNAQKDVSLLSPTPPSTEDPLERQLRIYADELRALATGSRSKQRSAAVPPIFSLSEEEAIHWITQTSQDKKRLEDGSLWSDPTAEDIRWFIARHNVRFEQGLDVFPQIIFTVPYEEFPKGPVYPGLTARLSYKDVPEWMRAREQRAKTALQWRARRELFDECGGDFDQVMGGRLPLLWHRYSPLHEEEGAGAAALAPSSSSGGERFQNHQQQNVRSDIKETRDIEDLIDKSPPCVAALLRQKRWYKDGERRQIVYQLRVGGASESLVERIFQRAESHSCGDDGSWDYKYAWRTKETFAQACSTVIRNTNTPNHAPCLTCVFSKEDDPRGRCLQEMQRRFPAKAKGIRRLNFPHQWFTSAAASGGGSGGK
jgi:hypothetical protein